MAEDARSRIPRLGIQANNNNAMPEAISVCRAVTHKGEIMKNFDIKEEDVIGFDALYESMEKTRKGVMWKDSVAAYYLRGAERTAKLSRELHDGTYRPSKPQHFMITSPKPREIASITYRDRVYQRSLNDNVVYPIMTRSFIYDNHACQKGRGTDAARGRIKCFLQKHYRRHGSEGYVAQFDIHGYYPNMRHDVVEEMFRNKLPDWAYQRVIDILHAQYDGDKGYNPGSQLVQIAGISLLDPLDHYIKERLHAKYYLRYMDDFLIIHHDKAYLENCFKEIKERLADIGFELNPKKSKIYPISDGIPFLGFVYRLKENGKVLMLANPEKIKEGRRRFRRLVAKAKKGKISRERVDTSFDSWTRYLLKGDTYNLVKRLKQFYNDLWEECNNENHQKNDDAR